ncbi:MAG: hypothetical protein AAGA42_12640 [Actinomycetota bacterium]
MRGIGATLAGLLAASSLLVALPTAEAAPPAPRFAPPAERVLLVADSVGLGAEAALPAAFPPTWEVNTVGQPARFVEQLESQYVRPYLGTSLVGDHVVIAGGYNYPYWDPARFERSIDSMIATLVNAGVEHVYWVTLREVKPQYISAGAWAQVQPYYWYFPAVNEHLRRAVSRHPNLTLVDWAAVADQTGITYDAIHLNRTGAALYSSLIADAVANAQTRSPNAGVNDVAAATAGDAVLYNLTTTGTRSNGYLTAYGCERDRPLVSSVNYGTADTVAGATIVPVGSSGRVCVYNHAAAQVIVDEFGRFVDESDRYDVPEQRVVDTRERSTRVGALETLRVKVTGPGRAPDDSSVVALATTAVDATSRGHVTVHPCDVGKTETSSLNFRPGVATPNLVFAQPDDDGMVCFTPSATTHLVVDLMAVFGPATSLAVGQSRRAVDTRDDPAPPIAGQVVRYSAADVGLDDDGAVIANITLANAARRGFATVYDCARPRPQTSNLNARVGLAVANLTIVEPGASGELCVYTNVEVEVIVDVIGTAGSGFVGTDPVRLFDTR